jgi:hypothetical protein
MDLIVAFVLLLVGSWTPSYHNDILTFASPPASTLLSPTSARTPRLTPRSTKDRVRLVMLYVLRFEGDTQRVGGLMVALSQLGLKASNPQLYAAMEGLLKYAGVDK